MALFIEYYEVKTRGGYEWLAAKPWRLVNLVHYS